MSGAPDGRTVGDVTVIGMDGGPLPGRAMAVLARAALVVGGSRHIEMVRHLVPPVTVLRVIDRDLPAVLAAVDAAEGRRVVLVDGDPGYFGSLRELTGAHGAVTVLPAVSSVAAAFAAAGVPWDDARVVSAHREAPHRAIAVCRRYPKVAVLTDASFGPAELGAALAHLDKRFVVGERLGHPDEQVTQVTAADAAGRRWDDPNVVVVTDPASGPGRRGWAAPPRDAPYRWALPSGDLVTSGAMARPEVRALVLAWAGPGPGDLVWDVASGGGPAAVEAARLGAAVIVVDDDEGACATASRSAAHHGVPLEVVQGRAPAALAGLPDADVVVVGGGDHLLTSIVRAAADRTRRAIVVVLDGGHRLDAARAALEDAGLAVEAAELRGETGGDLVLRGGRDAGRTA